MDHLVCWECLALMKRFQKFKWQVHSAQEHLRVLALSRTQETVDHTYMSHSLSNLEIETKAEYDKIYFEYSPSPEDRAYIISHTQGVKSENYEVAQVVRDSNLLDIEDHILEEYDKIYFEYSLSPEDRAYIISHTQNVKSENYEVAQVVRDSNLLDIEDHILEVPQIVLENPVTGVMSHIVVGTDALVSSDPLTHTIKEDMPHLTVGPITSSKIETVIMCQERKPKIEKTDPKLGYVTEYMSETEMLAYREEAKQKVQYASSVYKCELCIIGFYNQQQVEDHFVSAHRAKPGQIACKVCYCYIAENDLSTHTASHYHRYRCKLCPHAEYTCKPIQQHVAAHLSRHTNN
ncbi:hypothetical protein B5X24_HaOG216105, partial [Helicoverpa armigera]